MAVPPPPFTADPTATDKVALRRVLRAKRATFVAALDSVSRAKALAAICDCLTAKLTEIGAIAGYMAQGDEVDVQGTLLRAFNLGRTVALPHLTRGNRNMRFTRWSPNAKMTLGLLDIPQAEGAEQVEPTTLLVPLVGFDRSGMRIGQGGGYYDRWFAAHPSAMRIGVAWSVQEAEILPRDERDIPLHAIATEKDWIDFR